MALADILATLVRHDVAFIVVGGLAGVLLGAPVQTLDVDVVYARDEDNVRKLLAALVELDAVFRTDDRGLRPNETHLRSSGHKLLRTKHGVLDALGTIEQGTDYPALLADTVPVEVGGLTLRVVTLERLIAIKRQLSRPKDRVMLMILEATLEEQRRKK